MKVSRASFQPRGIDEAAVLRVQFRNLQRDYNLLVMEYKKLKLILDSSDGTLSLEDLQKLLSLCHPDKHGGKMSATHMTAKLLQLRTELRLSKTN